MTQTKTYKGVDLLDKIFEFAAMTPDQNQWNLSALKDNLPRHIRFRQIHSLIKAFFGQKNKVSFLDKAKTLFGDTTNVSIQSILAGDFIKTKSLDDYTELIDFIKEIVKEHEGSIEETRPMHVVKLVTPYQQLIRYKRQLIELLKFNSGWLETSSITVRFSIYLTDEISSNLSDKYLKLDKALELFVNPGELSFTEDELITHYEFPTDNVRDVDMDYI